MDNHLSRRDFLKFAGLIPLSIAAPKIMGTKNSLTKTSAQNVLVIVFDALSAHHLSLYGYQRETTPTLTKLAKHAMVYHNHYAGGNFTTPGTASLLTGTLPWTHRAFQPNGTVEESFVDKNIFAAYGHYYRTAYSHNLWANTIIRQFDSDLDTYIPRKKYFLNSKSLEAQDGFSFNVDNLIPTLFKNDEDIAMVSWLRGLQRKETGYSYSLFLSHLYETYRNRRFASLKALYPRGIPKDDNDEFLLEQAIDGIGNQIVTLPQPFMGYFHFWPPHAPYRTHRDFYNRFVNDGWTPISKPTDMFGSGKDTSLNNNCREYDEYILYVDREFRRFYEKLKASGILENTWIVLTSDHGELFERGIEGHRTPVLYEPVIRVPLMIFEPDRTTQMDIYETTSAIDILPTFLRLTGQPPALWPEGLPLPPFGPSEPFLNRSIYVVQADKSEQLAPLSTATIAIIKENYKLIYFFGYKELVGSERIELYNLKKDPEELNNIYKQEKDTAAQLLSELKKRLQDTNALFETT